MHTGDALNSMAVPLDSLLSQVGGITIFLKLACYYNAVLLIVSLQRNSVTFHAHLPDIITNYAAVVTLFYIVTNVISIYLAILL